MPEQRPGRSAVWLALAYAVLVLYASLYPFEGWRWPPGQPLWALVALPRSIYHDPFDIYSNLLGYLPLGALLGVALHRPGTPTPRGLMLSVLAAATLSYGCEVLQHFVPRRVPSLEDLGMNTFGAVLGALLGMAAQALGWVRRWHRLRERWFGDEGAAALGLLGMWPLGLLFPAPVPLGLGQVGERLREWAASLLQDVPWAESAHALLAQAPTTVAPPRPLAEVLIVALGLLAPCLVVYAVVAPGLRRIVMALVATLLAVLAMTTSTWLNFGPRHALAWLTPLSGPGLTLGLVLAFLLALLPRRFVPGLALVVLTGLVVGVAQAPADPYFALSLKAWEQGRFVRFHGLAQWVGWLWPYVAMGWLLSRLGSRSP